MKEHGEVQGWYERGLLPYMQPFDERYQLPAEAELDRSWEVLTRAVADKLTELMVNAAINVYENVIYRELALNTVDIYGVPVRMELFAFDKIARAGQLPEYGVSVLHGSDDASGFRYQHDYVIPEEVLLDEGVTRFDSDRAVQQAALPFISLNPVGQELEQMVGCNGMAIGEREACVIAGMILCADLAQ